MSHNASRREILSRKLVHWGIAQAPNRSTLSHAHEHRPAALYEEWFDRALGRFRSQQQLGVRKRTFRFKHQLLSLGSTTVSLCLGRYLPLSFVFAKHVCGWCAILASDKECAVVVQH